MTLPDNVLIQTAAVTLVSSALGALVSIGAKGLLNAMSVTLLSSGYGNIALIGAVAFGSFTLGLSLWIGYSSNTINWTSVAMGMCTFLPTVWLTGLPIIIAISLLFLNIFVSCIPPLFKEYSMDMGFLPFLILKPLL